MKRLLKFVALLVLLAVIGLVGVVAATFMGRRPVIDGQRFGGDIRVIADGFSSVGVIPIGSGEVALVDAGNDGNGAVILGELRRRGLGAEAVSAIFLTHGHSDHIGAVTQFPRAQVLAMAEEVELVEGRAASRGPLPRLFPVNPTGITVTRGLRDGDLVVLSGVPVRAYAVPGHTAGSAAYFVNGVLFVGDSADIASDGTLQGSPWLFSDSQAENRDSLVRLEQRIVADGLEVTAIVPAHSGASDGMEPLTQFAVAGESGE